MRRQLLTMLGMLLGLFACGGVPSSIYRQSYVYSVGPAPLITAASDTRGGTAAVGGSPFAASVNQTAVTAWNDFIVIGSSGSELPPGSASALLAYRRDPAGLLTLLSSTRIGNEGVRLHIVALQFAPTGRFVYVLFSFVDTAGHGFAVGINELDPASGALRPTFVRLLPDSGWDLKLSPDGSVLCAPGNIRHDAGVFCAAVDVDTGVVGTFNSYYMGTDCPIAFSPDGQFLAIARGESLELYSYTHEGKILLTPIAQAKTGSLQSFSVAFDPSGQYIAVANDYRSNDLSMFRFDQRVAKLTPVFGSPFRFTEGTTPWQVAFAASGKRIFVINRDETTYTTTLNAFSFDAETGAVSGPIASFRLPPDSPSSSAAQFVVSPR